MAPEPAVATTPAEQRAATRRMWHLLEPVHALTYFSPEVVDACTALGLKGFWHTYFAARVAPMGPVGPEVCGAAFFGFSPDAVRRALPSAWEVTTPAAVIGARDAAVRDVIADLLDEGDRGDGEGVAPSDVAEAADLAATAVEGCRPAGRALFAGHTTLPRPDDPVLRLWWAATLLREHRGDGHVAALVAAGLDGLQANVLMAGTGRVTPERMQGSRSWTPDDWAAATATLVDRGLVEPDGALTDDGRALRAGIEDTTDDLAREPWDHLGPEGTARLDGLLLPIHRRVLAAGRIAPGNPMGLPLDELG
jgi:hypothetical protein